MCAFLRRILLSLLSFAVLDRPLVAAFSPSATRALRTQSPSSSVDRASQRHSFLPIQRVRKLNFQSQTFQESPFSSTRLNMYNLPGGGGGPQNNGVGDIVRGAVTIAFIVAFFASPLGGLVLGLFNSFLVLLFILPVVASVGFRVWQSLNTITQPCPSCGAPATVLKASKDGVPTPTLCFNCGAVLQANIDNTGIDNISGRTSLDGLSTTPMGGNPFFDVFTTERVTTTTATKTTTSDAKEKKRRETTIIDVDVEDDDDIPFQ
ncbi:hypothetical protein IV203_031917 [Nitzschia inconspicua]|uniref:TFIIB-type domain-containing protein n=1 Tax=Nitzschia inconspicua TaxID=303405 RepID=A0A9K3LW63_9STRA|nr:hypothetical protein IV203_031917 [Nitzschia inconspicua]